MPQWEMASSAKPHMTKVTLIYDELPVAWLELTEVPLVGEIIQFKDISFKVRYRQHEIDRTERHIKPTKYFQTVVLIVDHIGQKPSEQDLKYL